MVPVPAYLHLVLFHQVGDATGELGNDLSLALEHGAHINLWLINLDAMLGEMMGGIIKMLTGIEQSLGWDAANVEAGATEAGPALSSAARFSTMATERPH